MDSVRPPHAGSPLALIAGRDLATIPVRNTTVVLPQWGIEFLIVTVEGIGVFFPIRSLCQVLGISSQMQIERLKDHLILSQFLVQLPIPTGRGRQKAYCLERRALGFWFGGISIPSLRKEVQPNMLNLQWDLLEAADRCLFGEVPSTPVEQRLLALEASHANVERFALVIEQRVGHLENVVLVDDDEES